MNSQAGKGDKIRPGANLKAYWDNYDNIFRKKKKTPYILSDSLQSEIDHVFVDGEEVYFMDNDGNNFKWPDDLEYIDDVQEFCEANNLKLVD